MRAVWRVDTTRLAAWRIEPPWISYVTAKAHTLLPPLARRVGGGDAVHVGHAKAGTTPGRALRNHWSSQHRFGDAVRVNNVETVALWRPTGPEELALVEASGWTSWPPRLPDQPIFYPVLNEEYATLIARDWNVPASGAGYVTRFHVRRDFLDRYEVHQVGGRTIVEYWIPADDLPELNANIVGPIEVVAEFH